MACGYGVEKGERAMNVLLKDFRSWGLVDYTRARSSGRPVNGHVVKQRPAIEVDYEKARHLVHQQLNTSGGEGEPKNHRAADLGIG